MSGWSLSFPPWPTKYSKDNKLAFLAERHFENAYGGRYKSWRRIIDAKAFASKYELGEDESELLISCSLGGKFIPVIDADCVEHRDMAFQWLDDHRIGWRCLNSSQNNFWIFVAKPGSLSSCLRIMKGCYGNDLRYVNLCREAGHIVIRGHLKPTHAGFKPRFISEGHYVQRGYICGDFTYAVTQHFEQPYVFDMYRRACYRQGINPYAMLQPQGYGMAFSGIQGSSGFSGTYGVSGISGIPRVGGNSEAAVARMMDTEDGRSVLAAAMLQPIRRSVEQRAQEATSSVPEEKPVEPKPEEEAAYHGRWDEI